VSAGRRHAPIVLLVALVLGGCKKKAGEPCEDSAACDEELVCVTWTKAHEEIIGDCEGKRCCTPDRKHEAAERAAQCGLLIDVVEAAHRPATHTLKIPRELEQLAIAVTTQVPTFSALELDDPQLAGFRDDYVAMSKELADAAKQRAFFVNRFDGPNAFKQIDRMKAVANREAAVVDKIRLYCKSADRPKPAFGGRASD